MRALCAWLGLRLRVIGPAIAAVLAATIGIGWCFIVNAVSFGFVIASLLSLDIRRLHPAPPVRRGRGQLRAGLRYAAAVPDIARPLLMMALAGTFTFEFETSLPLLAEKTFHGGATTYSWLIGALGAGAVAGGLYAARSGRTGVARLTSAAVFYAIAVGLGISPGVREGTTEDQRCIIRRAAVPHGGRRRSSSERCHLVGSLNSNVDPGAVGLRCRSSSLAWT